MRGRRCLKFGTLIGVVLLSSTFKLLPRYNIDFFFRKKENYNNNKKLYFLKANLAVSRQADSSITESLHLSLTLIRIPFQMSSQFLFSGTKPRLNK